MNTETISRTTWLVVAAHAANILRFGFSFRAHHRTYHYCGLADPFALQEAVHHVLISVAEVNAAAELQGADLERCVMRHAANFAAQRLDQAMSDLTPFGALSAAEDESEGRACA